MVYIDVNNSVLMLNQKSDQVFPCEKTRDTLTTCTLPYLLLVIRSVLILSWMINILNLRYQNLLLNYVFCLVAADRFLLLVINTFVVKIRLVFIQWNKELSKFVELRKSL